MKQINILSIGLGILFILIQSNCQKDDIFIKSGETYYVDSQLGNDSNNGKSPENAWKSLEKVNSVEFTPGCSILFKTGSIFEGQLKPNGSGAPDIPIIVDKYGEGELPRIDAKGNYGEALLLKNQEYWEINNLELTNLGTSRELYRYGVRLSVWDYGTMYHIHLKNLYVHDVNGSTIKKDQAEGGGIYFEMGGKLKSKSHIDDLLIEGCRLERTDRNGIGSYCEDKYRYMLGIWLPNYNVVIRNNYLEDIGGDGIKVVGCDGALIEHNIVRNASQRNDGYCCGIWPFSSTNTLIQYNEVSGMKGTRDGQAFDIDFLSRNTKIQYNYSHDNEGGFLLLCTPDLSRQNSTNIIRYNISQNDKNRTFVFLGPVRNTQIYNNVIYVKEESTVQLFIFGLWEDENWADGIHVYNNIFYVEGTAKYVHKTSKWNSNGIYTDASGFGGATNVHFSHNVYYGNHTNPPIDENGITVNPMLVSPGSGTYGINSLEGYKLMDGSPCINMGMKITNNGNKDFWSYPVPQDRNPDIGVHQISQ